MKKLCVVLFATLAFTSCSSATTSTTTTITNNTVGDGGDTEKSFEYTIIVGENTGPDKVISVAQGKTVTLNILNPSSHDDVHLHGYDLSTGSIEKGQQGMMTFEATKTGDFEIESHETQELISILRVTAP